MALDSIQGYGSIAPLVDPVYPVPAVTTRSRCGRFCSERCGNAVGAMFLTLAVEVLFSAIVGSQVILPELYKRGIPIDYKLVFKIAIPIWLTIAGGVGCCAYRHPNITTL